MLGVILCAVFLATTPQPSGGVEVDQTPPVSINGVTADGSTIWVASIAADEVLRVDAATGQILERYPTDGAEPDDVAIGPDGAVYTTGTATGEVGRIADGAYSVIATLEPAINPLEFSADGELFVGQITPGGTLWRVPLDGSAPEVVAAELPSINGFAVLDGAVIAPAGAFDPGSVISIDTTTGEVTTIADTFPTASGEPARLLASAADGDGNYFALDNLTGELFLVDLTTGDTALAWTLPGVWDNFTFATNGYVYFSSYTSPTITGLYIDGTATVIPVGDPALLPSLTGTSAQ